MPRGEAARILVHMLNHRHPLHRQRDTIGLMFDTDYLLLPFSSELKLAPHAKRFFFDLGASV